MNEINKIPVITPVSNPSARGIAEDAVASANDSIKGIIKKHPVLTIGLALVAGFVTHALAEKLLELSESRKEND